MGVEWGHTDSLLCGCGGLFALLDTGGELLTDLLVELRGVSGALGSETRLLG